MTRSEAIAANIAQKIVRNQTRKHWSRLHADTLEDLQKMANEKSSVVTSSMNVSDTPATRVQIGREATISDQGRKPQAGSTSTTDSPVTVGSQVNVGPTRPVDRRTIEGSTPGDHRATPGDVVKATMDKIANPPSPREQMRGQRTSKHYEETGKAFRSNMFTTGEETGD
jgi:hypothetical protein